MPNTQERLEDPIITGEENQGNRSKVMDQGHADHIVYFSAIMISKVLIFVLLRYFFMTMNNMDEKILLIDHYWSGTILLFTYFALTFVMHVSLPQISRTFMNILVVCIFLIELMLLMITVFSNLMVISATCMVLFYTVAIYHVKRSEAFPRFAMWMSATVIFTGGLVALELTDQSYISTGTNGFLKINMFIASLIFCLWSALYFEDPENFESVDPICTTFIFTLDSYIIIKKVWEQIKEEFYIYEREEKPSDLVIDKPIE